MTPFKKFNYQLGQKRAMDAVGLRDANAFAEFAEQDRTEEELDLTKQQEDKTDESPPHWSGGASLESGTDHHSSGFTGGGGSL